MKPELIIYFLCVAGSNISACPKNSHTYVYQVVEIPEPTMRNLGEYIVVRLKKQRTNQRFSCYDNLDMYIDETSGKEDNYDSVKMTGIFMHQFTNQPHQIFTGVEETEEFLKKNCTYNLLVTKEMPLRRFLLRNSTDGSVFEAYLTLEELQQNVKMNQSWEKVDMVECQHYLDHVSSMYGKNRITVTVVDSARSEEQLEFSILTQIGGFVKKECLEKHVLDKGV